MRVAPSVLRVQEVRDGCLWLRPDLHIVAVDPADGEEKRAGLVQAGEILFCLMSASRRTGQKAKG
jgi:hypothetical protein